MNIIFEKIGDDLGQRLQNYSGFKIGKTGQKLQDRYSGAYSHLYENYGEIYSSFNKAFIDNLEKYLIERFFELPNCDNENEGGGEMTNSNVYIAYIVFNYKYR